MTTEPRLRPRIVTPGRLVLAAVGYLAVAWGAIYAVDIAGVADLAGGIDAPLWIVLFHESYLTEWLQWGSLGAAALVAGHLGGRVRADGDLALGRFWRALAGGLALMLIEDAGNPRHALGAFAQESLGVPSFTANAVLLGTIALVLLYAVAAHWRRLLPLRPCRYYLAAAYAVYGLAGSLSATGPRWYPRLGAALNDALFAGRLPPYDVMEGPLDFLIADLMVEETVELVGASLFLAAVVAFATRFRDPTPATTDPPDSDRPDSNRPGSDLASAPR